jgi:hypothetical protein
MFWDSGMPTVFDMRALTLLVSVVTSLLSMMAGATYVFITSPKDE